MIPMEKLLAARTVYSHANCPDGIASAVLLNAALPWANIQFIQHGRDRIAPGPHQLWVDCCPPKERAKEFDAYECIVLDHHRTAEATIRSFRYHDFGDETADPGVSGAVLAYRVFARCGPDLPLYEANRGIARRFATLAGIRDTWQRDHPDWEVACAQAEAMLFYPLDQWIDRKNPWRFFDSNYAGLLEERRAIGKIARQQNLNTAKRLAEEARKVERTIRGKSVRVAVVPTRHITDAADILQAEVDLVVGFSYVWTEQAQLRLSFRGSGMLNFGDLAARLSPGGGGHTNAAGCTVPARPNQNPYTHIDDLLEVYGSES